MSDDKLIKDKKDYSAQTQKIEKNDYIIDKALHTLFFVVKRDAHNVLLRREKDDQMCKFPMHHVNAYFSKIDYEMAMILYGDENKNVDMEKRKDDLFDEMPMSI